MGVVYEAVDRVIDRRVAIKTIRNADLDEDEAAEQLRRFLIEARAAGKLNHPHIVSLYDHGDEAGITYLVMELVEGREMQRYFDDGVLFSIEDAVRLMGELLDALSFSHRQGVVHRDVKPDNILITQGGTLKLGDFGIARIESNQKTRAGIALGTPTHMAPEQIRGESADARSDLYAAGVVLFQLLTGQRPFSGTMLSMALKVLNEPAPKPSSINPQVMASLDDVVARALQKKAADRYQTAGEFWQALAQAVGLAMPLKAPLSDAIRSTSVSAPSRFDTSTFTNSSLTALSRTHASPGGAPPPAPNVPVAEVGTIAAAPPPPSFPAAARRRLSLWMFATIAAIGTIGVAWWSLTPRRSIPTQYGQPSPPSSATATPSQAPKPDAPPQRGLPPEAAPIEKVDQPRPAVQTAKQLQSATEAEQHRSSPEPAQPAQPVTKIPAPRKPTADDKRAAAVAVVPPTAAPQSARPARPERCSDILLKASLEPLTNEESRFLRRECQ